MRVRQGISQRDDGWTSNTVGVSSGFTWRRYGTVCISRDEASHAFGPRLRVVLHGRYAAKVLQKARLRVI
jgi:hypothetical protein